MNSEKFLITEMHLMSYVNNESRPQRKGAVGPRRPERKESGKYPALFSIRPIESRGLLHRESLLGSLNLHGLNDRFAQSDVPGSGLGTFLSDKLLTLLVQRLNLVLDILSLLRLLGHVRFPILRRHVPNFGRQGVLVDVVDQVLVASRSVLEEPLPLFDVERPLWQNPVKSF